MTHTWLSRRIAAIAAIVALSPAPGIAASEVVIERDALRPPALTVSVMDRVTFVNRSGRVVHLEFTGGDEHHVFQVPGRIWATFHRTGRHPYVVHFETGRGELRGAVEAVEDPEERTPPTCAGERLSDICIEQ